MSLVTDIRHFPDTRWPVEASVLLQQQIDAFSRCEGGCSVMLTGGRNAKLLFEAWSQIPSFRRLQNVAFYFGDERCVPPDDPDSNYGMTMSNLFGAGVPRSCTVYRMEAESDDLDAAANHYAAMLPKSIDILLLGLGDDGHIASLFPGSTALHENERRIVPIIGPKKPYRRLTITPRVILEARSVYVLAAGAEKASVLAEARRQPTNIDDLPARLVIGRTWLTDMTWNPPTCCSAG
jgi:6-phosphogluconolactonase